MILRVIGYLKHDQDRAVFIDIDLHHGKSLTPYAAQTPSSTEISNLSYAGRQATVHNRSLWV